MNRRTHTVWNREPSRFRGFTLMELLVVIALISIIAGILLPVLALAREEARKTTCLSQIQQMARAHTLYMSDWDEQLPDWRYPGPVRPETPHGFIFWMDYLQPYLRNRAIFSDPSYAAPPLPPGEGLKLADYGLMTWGPSGSGAPESPHFQWADPPFSMGQVRRPTETIMLMDGYTTTETSHGFEARHRKGVNAAFIDGHARWLPFWELYRIDRDSDGYHYYHYASVDR